MAKEVGSYCDVEAGDGEASAWGFAFKDVGSARGDVIPGHFGLGGKKEGGSGAKGVLAESLVDGVDGVGDASQTFNGEPIFKELELLCVIAFQSAQHDHGRAVA